MLALVLAAINLRPGITSFAPLIERIARQVTRVEAHLTDNTGHQRIHPEEIQCTLEARLVGLEPVVVKDQAGSAHQAIQGAVGKLQRAVAAVLGKHDAHR